MKTKITLMLAIIFVLSLNANAQCCKKGVENKVEEKACCSSEKVEEGEVNVYYFHATRRCATCKAVESETQKTITENFKGKVNFVSINREKDSKNPLLKKYKVNGQTLLVVKGETVENLTNTAFMYARTKPEKYQQKLSDKLKGLL